MKLISVYKKINELGLPTFQTNDISILLNISNKQGNYFLKKLSDEKLIIHLRRGTWGIKEKIDPLILPQYLTAPMPSYTSLQSALYYHGMISQIPSLIYAISLARTRQYKTPVGIYSIHHINPELFFGFDIVGKNAVPLATPEKALFDFFYFSSVKSKLFYQLPELEIPKNFNWNLLLKYAKKIVNPSRKMMVIDLIEKNSSL